MTAILISIGLFILGLTGTAEAAVNFSVSSLVTALLTIIVIACICWLLWWLIGYAGLPEPFNKIARVIIAVVAVLFLINFLLSLIGSPMFTVGR
jgi:hypothetical protein